MIRTAALCLSIVLLSTIPASAPSGHGARDRPRLSVRHRQEAWQIDYGAFPADAFVFADGGVIKGEAHSTTISSFGGGLRLNAIGFPMEIAALRALDGPRPRWQFDLGFRVGF